jgi:hypothetical protein
MRVRYGNRGDIEFLQDFNILVDWNAALVDKTRMIVIFEEDEIKGFYFCQVRPRTFRVDLLGGDDRTIRYMLKELKGRARKQKRLSVSLLVSEYLTDLHKALKDNQFVCAAILPGSPSSYLMICRL